MSTWEKGFINHIDETFESIMGKALRSESLYPKPKTEAASAEEPKPQASGGGKNGSQNKRKQGQSKVGQKKSKKDVECFSCGKKVHYAKDCRAKTADNKCFNCGQVGHHKDKCLQPRQMVKAYALNAIPSSSNSPTAAEKGKNVVIQGMLSVYDVPVRVLFDTGASSSFISSDLVDRLGLEPEIVDRPLVVTNPIGGSTSLCMICRNVVLSSHGCMFVCDCFVLGFTVFGIILGVDWLQRYGVVVDCEGFLVTVRADDGRREVFGGLPSNGVMVSFLNSLDIPHDELSNVLILSEYPDIFEGVT